MSDLFVYSKGYDFRELQHMADGFSDLYLPGMRSLNIENLLGEYIFGISMNRFPVGRKHTLRRFLGGLFSYSYTVTGEGNKVFLFTGDGQGRPDYVNSLEKVARQCDSYVLIKINRQKLFLKPWRVFSVIPETIWALKINKIVKCFYISFDMAVSLYRAKKSAQELMPLIMQSSPKLVTVFCDAWAIENVIVQNMKKYEVSTATLQHGNGTDIFLGTCADTYLANSLLSKDNAVRCGVPSERLFVAGPMKYAGETYNYRQKKRLSRIGVVFDGANNLQNNIEMIDVVRKALEDTNIEVAVRFHPNNKPEDYQDHVFNDDVFFESLDEFESNIDLCIVYNSSMYTDMIYKKIPVVRYKNGNVDLFSELDDRGFSNSEQLLHIIEKYNQDYDGFLVSQRALYDKVFGNQCGKDSYRNFLMKW